jgi:hypothetical protein
MVCPTYSISDKPTKALSGFKGYIKFPKSAEDLVKVLDQLFLRGSINNVVIYTDITMLSSWLGINWELL